jgi:hypothetical protein
MIGRAGNMRESQSGLRYHTFVQRCRIDFDLVIENDYDHVVGKKLHRNFLCRHRRSKFLRRNVLIVCREMQALRRGVTLVLRSSHTGKKMYVANEKWFLVKRVDDTVCCRQNKVRCHQRPRALAGYSQAGSIDLAYGVPRWSMLLETHPIVFADYAGMQVLT